MKIATYWNPAIKQLSQLEDGAILTDVAGNPITGGLSSIEVRDEGSFVVDATIFDFVGGGIIASTIASGKATITVAVGAAPVASVNGKTGVVVLDPDDLDDTSTTNKFITQAELDKLAAIEANATADQTGAEIKSAYEGEANTNAFTDAEQTKLVGIEALAKDDQTGAEIKAAYEGEANTNAFTDAEQSKLTGIETGADVTDNTNVDAAGAVMDSDFSEAEGFMRKISTGTYEVFKSNLGATTDPGGSNDNTQGYKVGSRWINVTLDKEFVALDVSTATAIWKETTGAAGAGTKVMITLPFTYTNIAASETKTMGLAASTATVYEAGANGSIRRSALRVASSRTAGMLTAKPTINGTPVGSSAYAIAQTGMVDGETTVLASGVITFSAGDLIGIQLDADGFWDPVTDASGILVIEEDT